jgi:hypothetical protein
MNAENCPAPPLNSKLPFEILFMIFEFYSIWDGVNDPLEKLLFVCKSWSTAARQHKYLWRSFRINTFLYDGLRFWSSRIPRRLDLCGESTLLDVDLWSLSALFTSKERANLVLKITKSLIGEDFCLVRRWRHLCLVDQSSEFRELWAQALSQPTPNLRSFFVDKMVFRIPILPSAPLLEEFNIINCSFELCSSLEQLKTLRLEGNIGQIRNLENMVRSNRLESLELTRCRGLSRFASNFPVLHSFHLKGLLKQNFVERFSAPRLRSLHLHVYVPWRITTFAQCSGVIFSQLTALHLEYAVPSYLDGDNTPTIKGLREIVRACTNVQSFQTTGRLALRILLLCFQEIIQSGARLLTCTVKVFLEDNQTPYAVKTSNFTFSTETAQTDIIHIQNFAHISPEETWKDIKSTRSSQVYHNDR